MTPRSTHTHTRSDVGAAAPTFLLSLTAIVVLSGLLAYGAFATYDISAKAASTASANAQIDAQTLPLEQLPHANAVTARILENTRKINDNLAPVLAQSLRSSQLSADIIAQTNQTRPLVVEAADLSQNILALNRQIESTAASTQDVAASILDVNKRVQRDVAAINTNLNATIAIAHQIRSDTGNILSQTGRTLHLNACIDREAHGAEGQDGQCTGTASSRAGSQRSTGRATR